MYTRALSNIRSSTWLSLRDCALTRSPSRTRTALAASLSPASWAEPDSDVAQTKTNNSLIVLIRFTAIHSLDFKNAGNDRRVAVQMHHHRFRQELHCGGCVHLRHHLRLGLQYAVRVYVDEGVVKDPLQGLWVLAHVGLTPHMLHRKNLRFRVGIPIPRNGACQ